MESIPPQAIIILTDWFTPGFRAGGPITSCWNLSNALSSKTEIFAIISDRDLHDTQPYPGIKTNSWVNIQKNISVCHLSPSKQTCKNIMHWINSINAKVIYLNSLFSRVFTIYPLYLKWRGKLNKRIVLAPRGMLKDSALRFKSIKKQCFLFALRSIQLAKWIDFHATDEKELMGIKEHIGQKTNISLIPNIPATVRSYERKPIGKVFNFLFVERIHPIKGLLEALRFLKE